MTIAFAHLLAAALCGLLGYFGFVLARRSIGPGVFAVAATLFWWLPLIFVLIGTAFIGDYAHLSTELSPSALLLGAALARTEALARRPAHFLWIGALCGLAVGAKYQALPLAAAVIVVALLLVGDLELRRGLARGLGLWVAGAVAPFVPIALAMALSSSLNTLALRAQLNFLGAYSGQIPFRQRLPNLVELVGHVHLLLLLLLVVGLAVGSSPRVRLARAVYVGAGLVTLFASGLVVGHYLIFMYVALAMAIGLPIRPEASLTWASLVELDPLARNARHPGPGRPRRVRAGRWVAAVVWTVARGGGTDRPPRPRAVVRGAHRDPVILPAGRGLPTRLGRPGVGLGAGAVRELRVAQRNPVCERLPTDAPTPADYGPGDQLVRNALTDPSTDCVVDAVGLPFFGIPASGSLLYEYPDIADLLLVPTTALRMPSWTATVCHVYVRR